MALSLMPQSACHGNLLSVESRPKSRSFGDTFSSCSQGGSASAMDLSLMPQSACHGNSLSVESRPKSRIQFVAVPGFRHNMLVVDAECWQRSLMRGPVSNLFVPIQSLCMSLSTLSVHKRQN